MSVCETEELTLNPGELFLLDTVEIITMPENAVGWLALKSSMGRLGLEHLHAGFFDPGFTGTATLEMENRAPWPITLKRNQRIIQLALADVMAPERSYRVTGRYNGQSVPTEAK
jgi:dCTP deaminase